MTEPHKKVTRLLEELSLIHTSEEQFGFYSVDIYLNKHNLIIEVMGDYWHANPIKYKSVELLNKIQLNDINRDTRKETYIKRYRGIHILYLWESDINKRLNLCKLLIEEYVSNKGQLKNYHTFNYRMKKSDIVLNRSIVLPLWKTN